MARPTLLLNLNAKMPVAKYKIWLLSILCFISLGAASQDNLLQREISLQFAENNVAGHIESLLLYENISIAFNSSRIKLDEIILFNETEITVEEFVRTLFYGHEISLSTSPQKIIVTFLDNPIKKAITIRGIVKDAVTGEVLVGASIIEVNSNTSAYTNENGFYSLTIPREDNVVHFRYLGYKTIIKNTISTSVQDASLFFDNELTEVVITESISDHFQLGSGGERIDLSLTEGFSSIVGENDVIKSIRVNSGVQSGNEGQTGMLVRGGSTDQNLILFEGVPLYEVSHIVGLSSIFIDESIHSVDFIKNGFPARYGGRLSSVLDVKLKDGDQSGFHGSVNASLPSATFHLEGPIFNKQTTFNLSGRKSYLNSFINEILGDVINYKIGLDYEDIVGKVSHRLSQNSKLSFSVYNGGDELGLVREQEQFVGGDFFKTHNDNKINWGNTVWNINFNNILSDKLIFNANLGGLNYNLLSRSSFSLNSEVGGLSNSEFLDIISYSSIKDNLANFTFDYYATDKHRLKFGGGWTYHQYNPTVRSNKQLIDTALDSLITEEDLIKADELALYFEDTYTPNENWQVYLGMHLSGYRVEGVSYNNLQPRFSLVYKPNVNNRLTFSYTRMNQYIHLLINPGVGLPSNLWVPSTDRIKPETSDQLSISYDAKLSKTIDLAVSGYSKQLNNLVDFRSANVYLGVLGGSDRPVFLEDPEWRDKVNFGSGTSNGLELQLRKSKGRFQGWASYSLSRTNRTFESIDDGTTFPYKYDRTHDINIGLKYSITPSFSATAHWIYGTGNRFSLAIEEFPGTSGIETFANAGERNKHQLPPYHSIDFQLTYLKEIQRGTLTFNLGLFNAYNRKNIFYLYIYDNPFEGESDIRQTTIFPILPNFNIGYSF